MLGNWRAKVVASGSVYVEDHETLDEGKRWAAGKLSDLGHDVTVEWRDRENSSVAVPGKGLELHVTRRE